MLGAAQEGPGKQIFAARGVSLESLRQEVERLLGRGEAPDMRGFTPEAMDALELAVRIAARQGRFKASTEHILLALLDNEQCARVLQGHGISRPDIEEHSRTSRDSG